MGSPPTTPHPEMNASQTEDGIATTTGGHGRQRRDRGHAYRRGDGTMKVEES